MNTFISKAIGIGLFFLFIFSSGFWLSRSGKPYGAILFNAHKLIALGAFVYLAIAVYRLNQTAAFVPLQIAAIAFTGLCAVIAIVTGGLMSIDRAMPAFIPVLHHVTPYLIVLSSAATLYLLYFSNNEMYLAQ